MSFKDSVIRDMNNVFLNTKEFGEKVTLLRGSSSVVLNALYDTPSLDGLAIGAETQAIAHQPRLIVSSADLPGGTPVKGDLFILTQNQFHGSGTFEGVDYAKESDGSITYKLKEVTSI